MLIEFTAKKHIKHETKVNNNTTIYHANAKIKKMKHLSSETLSTNIFSPLAWTR